jgi:hypothetical protein
MNTERDDNSPRSNSRLSDQDLYRAALRAARAGDRDTAARLYVLMADRGMAWTQQRDVMEALFPAVPRARGLLTTAGQERAFQRFARSRK